MAKFKVGDRVKVYNHPYSFCDQVAFGEIVDRSRSRGDWSVKVTYIAIHGETKSQALGFNESEMRLAPKVAIITTPAIVAVIENGTPKPNKAPKIHATEADATKEAERLASRNPGEKFGVFVMTTARVADVTVRVV